MMLLSKRWFTLIVGLSLTLQARGSTAAQTESPTVRAFRESTKNLAEKLRFAAQAMPEEEWGFRPSPLHRTFGEIARTIYPGKCGRIADVQSPIRADPSNVGGKDSVIALTAQVFTWCDQVIAKLSDSKLSDSLSIGTQYCCTSVSRAEAMLYTAAYWGAAYEQMVSYLRMTGRAPPEPCSATVMKWNLNDGCDSGHPMCTQSGGGRRGYRLILSDAGYSVRSDGGGAYVSGVGQNLMTSSAADNQPGRHRSITIDLNHPVPGDIGVPLGDHVEHERFAFEAQWYTGPDFVSHSPLEIPVGQTVNAEQIELNFVLNGERHMLQVGPQPGGHCFSDATTIYGAGTSRGTIHRESEDRWIVDLPSGSIGRLFDRHLGDPHAVNKGLYYVSLHFIVEK
jgi:hypothetical protein